MPRESAPASSESDVIRALKMIRAGVDALIIAYARGGDARPSPRPVPEPVPHVTRVVRAARPSRPSGDLGRCASALLGAIAARGERSTRIGQLGVMTGYRSSSGGFRNSLSTLYSKALVEGPRSAMRATAAGAELAGIAPLPRGSELLEHWRPRLGKCGSAVVQELMTAHPAGLTPEELARRLGYSGESGGFRNALSRVRTLDLAAGYGELVAARELIP